MAENLECPECHEPIAPDDFQCEQCELLLNPQVASGEYVITDPSIVRALLSPPQRTSSREMPASPPRTRVDDSVTARFSVPLDEDTVPYLVARLDTALQPLHPFVAYVASFIDGTQTVAALARAARLPEIEIKVVLKSLFEQNLVELHRQPAPAPPEDALPLLNGADFLEEGASSAPAPEAAMPPPPPPEAVEPPPPPRIEPPLPRNPFSLAPAPARPATNPPIPPRPSSPATPPPIARTAAPPTAARTSVPTPPPVRPPSRSTPTVTPLQEPPAPSRSQERNEDFLQRAVRLEREGQVDRAIELLKRGLARSAAPAPLYNKLALILVNQRKDYLQASELLERAVELEPHNPVFQQNLLKVVGLAANTPGLHGKKPRGILERITGRSS
ncbi:tetratricopeptide repeat protein [Hyalangium gracile]|uniref:tetratricopeptide repeat protein n=1 Tax=Hyalangium gracile TaxID=394092 RepID=UPI001CCD7A14|nr:tetratricopeptide repeat protein [Hyalangium gracile]